MTAQVADRSTRAAVALRGACGILFGTLTFLAPGISLAALVTSGTGLLAYVNDDPGPPWLRSMVLVSAAMVAISFVGWLVMSLAAFAHEMSTR